jgi:hypothetical protein
MLTWLLPTAFALSLLFVMAVKTTIYQEGWSMLVVPIFLLMTLALMNVKDSFLLYVKLEKFKLENK